MFTEKNKLAKLRRCKSQVGFRSKKFGPNEPTAVTNHLTKLNFDQISNRTNGLGALDLTPFLASQDALEVIMSVSH